MPRSALIVVDMVNTCEFEDADRLAESVEETLPAMRGLIDRAAEEETLTIYVNDTFGRWRSNSDELVEAAKEGRHGHLVEPVAPPEHALFVVKARHSIGQVRHFRVAVPRDAVAHIHEDLAEASLRMMEVNMDAEICDAGDCRLGASPART